MLSDFARDCVIQASGTKRVDVAELVRDVVALARPALVRAADDGRAIDVVTELRAGISAVWPVAELRGALLNLLSNSIDACADGGTVRVVADLAAGTLDRVQLEVHDDGAGMAPDVQARCKDPFYSTRSDPRRGLGLCSVQRVVDALGGTVAIRSEIDRGTEVSVSIPRVAAAPHR